MDFHGRGIPQRWTSTVVEFHRDGHPRSWNSTEMDFHGRGIPQRSTSKVVEFHRDGLPRSWSIYVDSMAVEFHFSGFHGGGIPFMWIPWPWNSILVDSLTVEY